MPAPRKFADTHSAAPERPAQAPRKADADPANSNAFAGDGRPFSKSNFASPSRQAKAKRGMFTGYAPSLTLENLDTPEKRQAARAAFVESCYFGNTQDGRPASRLVDLAWRELSGDALTSEERSELAEQRASIKAFNDDADAQIAAQAGASGAVAAQKAVAEASAQLRILREALAEAENSIAGATVSLATALAKAAAPFSEAFNVGKKIAGAREVATVLREKLIPDAEKALADVQSNREAA